MKVNSLKLIYFSPTGTTRKVLEGIAQGLPDAAVEHIDLTPSDAKIRKFPDMGDDLAVIGSPVYAGRLPNAMVSRLRRVKGNGAQAVIVVVYGNRAYEDALRELRDIAEEAGFKPVAAGAFIGEHSYSTRALPIAAGRPDGEDLRKAQEFGKKIFEKMRSVMMLDQLSRIHVPGNFPYKQGSAVSGISPGTQEAVCAKCEECARVCPVAAISVQDTVTTDRSLCIRCCACVKTCSTGARVLDDPRIQQVSEQLSINCRNRKEPEIYI